MWKYWMFSQHQFKDLLKVKIIDGLNNKHLFSENHFQIFHSTELFPFILYILKRFQWSTISSLYSSLIWPNIAMGSKKSFHGANPFDRTNITLVLTETFILFSCHSIARIMVRFRRWTFDWAATTILVDVILSSQTMSGVIRGPIYPMYPHIISFS